MRIGIFKKRERGQSIAEVAIALPVLLMLVVGIVELGHALTAYNQTINASREGARFGSMGGSDTAIQTIVQAAPSQLITYDETNSDMYVVRAELTGNWPGCSVVSDTYSCNLVVDNGELDTSCVTSDELIDRLDTGEMVTCDLDVVAVDLYYRSPSLLGMPLIKQLSEATPMRSLTVMRMETPRPLSAICNAYPIAVHRSVFVGKGKGDEISDILNGTEEGKFGWLRWPYDPSGGSSDTLADALNRPTTSEFQNAVDPTDTHLSVGDWIWSNTGVGNDSKVREALDKLIDKGWIRVVVWDQHSYEGGSNGKYHAVNFAIVQLTSYRLPGTNKISIIFEGMDSTGCVD
jgi:Flp pilus assembly protein TadG